MVQLYGTLEGGREVLLTFDDGPHPKLTPKVLDALKEHNAKGGVFFVLGKAVKVPGGKAIVKCAFDEGHRIGNQELLSYDRHHEPPVRGNRIKREEHAYQHRYEDHER